MCACCKRYEERKRETRQAQIQACTYQRERERRERRERKRERDRQWEGGEGSLGASLAAPIKPCRVISQQNINPHPFFQSSNLLSILPFFQFFHLTHHSPRITTSSYHPLTTHTHSVRGSITYLQRVHHHACLPLCAYMHVCVCVCVCVCVRACLCASACVCGVYVHVCVCICMYMYVICM